MSVMWYEFRRLPLDCTRLMNSILISRANFFLSDSQFHVSALDVHLVVSLIWELFFN